MPMTNQAAVGDVIKSDLFQYGNAYKGSTTIQVGRFYRERVKDEDTGELVETGKILPSGNNVNPERATAEYVVEHARSEGGGIAHRNDVYPDGWHVKARRLTSDGKLDPEGEVIEFYQSGCFNCMVPEVEVVRSMRMAMLSQ